MDSMGTVMTFEDTNSTIEEENSLVEEESLFEEGIACTSDFGCDQYGNPKTADGFIDETGKWVDLTNFEPDPIVVQTVEATVAGTVNQQKAGN